MRLSERELADIQGFITSGYGHLPLATYVFLEIRDAARAQDYLAQLAPTITTAAPWPRGEDGRKLRPVSAVNVAFTAAGLAALGLPRSVRCTFPSEFEDGMASPRRSAILGDTGGSAPERWAFGGPAQPPIHMVLIVHGASPAELERACGEHRERVNATQGGVAEIDGIAQSGYRPEGGHEAFGFHDGISQPSIRGITGDARAVPTGEFILGYANHYEVVPPSPVVAEELDAGAVLAQLANPYHAGKRLRDLGLNGTYVVYRKLEQDVVGFWRFMKSESVRMTGREDAACMVSLAARCMGRWPSGAPLALTPDRDEPALRERDDFSYDRDPDGYACPLGAHIRRTHPRAVIKPYGTAESLSMSEAHRLLRRGRVFGPPLLDPALLGDPLRPDHARALLDLRDDGAARGVHFWCVNASIASQFEFVQQTWCNNPRFGGLHDNADPVVGDNDRPDGAPSRMTIPRRTLAWRTAPLPRFVTVRGGAYFFMPGLNALRFLAGFRV